MLFRIFAIFLLMISILFFKTNSLFALAPMSFCSTLQPGKPILIETFTREFIFALKKNLQTEDSNTYKDLFRIMQIFITVDKSVIVSLDKSAIEELFFLLTEYLKRQDVIIGEYKHEIDPKNLGFLEKVSYRVEEKSLHYYILEILVELTQRVNNEALTKKLIDDLRALFKKHSEQIQELYTHEYHYSLRKVSLVKKSNLKWKDADIMHHILCVLGVSIMKLDVHDSKNIIDFFKIIITQKRDEKIRTGALLGFFTYIKGNPNFLDASKENFDFLLGLLRDDSFGALVRDSFIQMWPFLSVETKKNIFDRFIKEEPTEQVLVNILFLFSVVDFGIINKIKFDKLKLYAKNLLRREGSVKQKYFTITFLRNLTLQVNQSKRKDILTWISEPVSLINEVLNPFVDSVNVFVEALGDPVSNYKEDFILQNFEELCVREEEFFNAQGFDVSEQQIEDTGVDILADPFEIKNYDRFTEACEDLNLSSDLELKLKAVDVIKQEMDKFGLFEFSNVFLSASIDIVLKVLLDANAELVLKKKILLSLPYSCIYSNGDMNFFDILIDFLHESQDEEMRGLARDKLFEIVDDGAFDIDKLGEVFSAKRTIEDEELFRDIGLWFFYSIKDKDDDAKEIAVDALLCFVFNNLEKYLFVMGDLIEQFKKCGDPKLIAYINAAIEKQIKEKGYNSYKKAIFFYLKGDYENSMQLLIRICRANPANKIALFNLGLACLKNGNLEKAQECFSVTVNVEEVKYQSLFFLGKILFEKQQYDEAIASFLQVTDKYFYTQACFYKAMALKEKGELDAAVVDFSRAISVNPYFLDAYMERWRIYYLKRLFRQAEEDLDKIREIDERIYRQLLRERDDLRNKREVVQVFPYWPKQQEINRFFTKYGGSTLENYDFDEIKRELISVFGEEKIELVISQENFSKDILRAIQQPHEKQKYVIEFIKTAIWFCVKEDYCLDYKITQTEQQKRHDEENLLEESKMLNVFREKFGQDFSLNDLAHRLNACSNRHVFTAYDFIREYSGTEFLEDGFAVGITDSLLSGYNIFSQLFGLLKWEATYGSLWIYDHWYHTDMFFKGMLATGKPIVFFIPKDIGDPRNKGSYTYKEIEWLADAIQRGVDLRNVIFVFDSYDFFDWHLLTKNKELNKGSLINPVKSMGAIIDFLAEEIVPEARTRDFRRITQRNIAGFEAKQIMGEIMYEPIRYIKYYSKEQNENVTIKKYRLIEFFKNLFDGLIKKRITINNFWEIIFEELDVCTAVEKDIFNKIIAAWLSKDKYKTVLNPGNSCMEKIKVVKEKVGIADVFDQSDRIMQQAA